MKHLKSYNESIRDFLKPKSTEDIIKSFGDKTSNEILETSIINNHLDGVKYAIENGADVNHINKYSHTPLMTSSNHGEYDIVKFLLDNGADVNIVSDEGFTALKLCSNNIRPLLIKHGAKIDNFSDNIVKSGVFNYIIGSGSYSIKNPSLSVILDGIRNMIYNTFYDDDFSKNRCPNRKNYREAFIKEISNPFIKDIDKFAEEYLTLQKPYSEGKPIYYGMREDINYRDMINDHFKNSKIITDIVKNAYNLYRWDYAGEKPDPEHYEYLGEFPNKTVKRKN